MCGHVLHAACLRTWYAGTSLKCPVCNTTQTIDLQDVACSTCKESVQAIVGDSGGAEAHLVLSLKCGHVHRSNCQADYMASLGTRYNITPSDYLPFLLSIHEGCRVCAGGPSAGPSRDISRVIAMQVPRGPNVTNYMPGEHIQGAGHEWSFIRSNLLLCFLHFFLIFFLYLINFPNESFWNKSVSLSSNIYSSAWVMCNQVKYDDKHIDTHDIL